MSSVPFTSLGSKVPRIAFCTTVKGRTPHLQLTLPKNLADNADYPNAVFVVLDYNSPDNLAEFMKENFFQESAEGRVAFYQYREPGPFRMAHAKNMAHRCGILEGADILVNLDADNFTGPGFARYIAEQFMQAKEEIFLWAEMIKDGEGRLPRGISGRIVVSADTFLKSGGYDEKYETHSPDDKDFNARLRRMGVDGRKIPASYLRAVMHNDKMRFREYKHAALVSYEEVFGLDPNATVVNQGRIGCGTVWKNFSPESTSLKPVPTRIFGIGMHKTATTSLHEAFKLLGFSSGHWETAHWAKAIWREMTERGKSPTLEKFYALCDLPIPVLFRELNIAYPGSKFILTVRNEVDWLRSVQRHWSAPTNPFKSAWNSDPFTHQIHRIIYGRRDFDALTFLERYRRHNAEVLDYFKDRPDDLLVVNTDEDIEYRWNDLCKFLDVPVPDAEFPNENVTKDVPEIKPTRGMTI